MQRSTPPTTDAPDRRATQRGFSLFELVLVVAIIAVIGGLAAPRFANASAGQRLEAAAQRVEADIALARQRARAASHDYLVKFSTPNQYTLANNDASETQTTDLAAEPYRIKAVTTLDSAGTDLTFNGFGTPDTGGTITLTGGGRQIILDIDPVSGGVTRR